MEQQIENMRPYVKKMIECLRRDLQWNYNIMYVRIYNNIDYVLYYIPLILKDSFKDKIKNKDPSLEKIIKEEIAEGTLQEEIGCAIERRETLERHQDDMAYNKFRPYTRPIMKN